MSRDGIIYKIKELDLIGDTIDSNSLDWGSYMYEDASRAPEYMKKYGRKMNVVHHLTNFQKASLENFKKEHTSLSYCNYNFIFFNKEEKLGTLSSEQLEKYNYDETRESYVIRVEEIANIDNCYNLKLSSGIHTFEEMFEESLRIVDEEESDSFYSSNVVYGLLRGMCHARKGDIILFYID